MNESLSTAFGENGLGWTIVVGCFLIGVMFGFLLGFGINWNADIQKLNDEIKKNGCYPYHQEIGYNQELDLPPTQIGPIITTPRSYSTIP